MRSPFRLLLLLPLFLCLNTFAENHPHWMRYPSLSPDGTKIAFSYQGDIFIVPATGGKAQQITRHPAYEYRPIWSPDSKHLAFASDRNGNFDIYLSPTEGGKEERLTYHSADQYPECFAPDGHHVLFSARIQKEVKDAQFPETIFTELYRVPSHGGRVEQILSTPAQEARFDPTGRYLVYQDKKGYEDHWRKHHTSSVTRDIWLYDTQNKTHQKLTSYKGEDLYPVFNSDGSEIYFLSEESGSFNVFRLPVSNPADLKQVTEFENHPIRFLSLAKGDRLCFGYQGSIYIKEKGQKAQKVEIDLRPGSSANDKEYVMAEKGATQMALSPNGKEFAFILRGNVFVSSIEFGTTKQITSSPEQERSVSFNPDGRSLLYASEKEGSWNLYQSKLIRNEEQFFSSSTLVEEEPILKSDANSFQPKFSPDGKELAYLEERTNLRILNLATQKIRTVFHGMDKYSYADGDQYFTWSPDGKHLLYTSENNMLLSEVYLVDATDQKEAINLTQSGYNDIQPQWGLNGNLVYWLSDRQGMHEDVAWWGSQYDVYGLLLNQKSYNRFTLSKEDHMLLHDKSYPNPASIQPPLDEQRMLRLTPGSGRLSAALLSKDGEHLYILERSAQHFELKQIELRTKKEKLLAQLPAKGTKLHKWKNEKDGVQLLISPDETYLYASIKGHIFQVSIANQSKDEIPYKAEYVLNHSQERRYLFDHVWRQVRDKFYTQDLHKVDWSYFYQSYQPFLTSINNDRDFAELLSEILGELNASHTGCRYYLPHKATHDATASLGAFLSYSGKSGSLKVEEILPGGPLQKAEPQVKAGMEIKAINGQPLDKNTNYYALLNHLEDRNTLLEIYNPATRSSFQTLVKPIGQKAEYRLIYQRWEKQKAKACEKLSNGKVGYVHIEGMDIGNYRKAYSKILGIFRNKEALVIDTRFNGGGWIHDPLANLLNGKRYLNMTARGQYFDSEPLNAWDKPSVVLINQGNYSDANGFPYTYRQKEIGQLVGMPVPGTMTAVWWERQINPSLRFGIPQLGMQNLQGEYLENQQLSPDVELENLYEKLATGKDQQLEKAVELILSDGKYNLK